MPTGVSVSGSVSGGLELVAPLCGVRAVGAHDDADGTEAAQSLTDEVLGVVFSVFSVELVAAVHTGDETVFGERVHNAPAVGSTNVIRWLCHVVEELDELIEVLVVEGLESLHQFVDSGPLGVPAVSRLPSGALTLTRIAVGLGPGVRLAPPLGFDGLTCITWIGDEGDTVEVAGVDLVIDIRQRGELSSCRRHMGAGGELDFGHEIPLGSSIS